MEIAKNRIDENISASGLNRKSHPKWRMKPPGNGRQKCKITLNRVDKIRINRKYGRQNISASGLNRKSHPKWR